MCPEKESFSGSECKDADSKIDNKQSFTPPNKSQFPLLSIGEWRLLRSFLLTSEEAPISPDLPKHLLKAFGKKLENFGSIVPFFSGNGKMMNLYCFGWKEGVDHLGLTTFSEKVNNGLDKEACRGRGDVVEIIAQARNLAINSYTREVISRLINKIMAELKMEPKVQDGKGYLYTPEDIQKIMEVFPQPPMIQRKMRGKDQVRILETKEKGRKDPLDGSEGDRFIEKEREELGLKLTVSITSYFVTMGKLSPADISEYRRFSKDPVEILSAPLYDSLKDKLRANILTISEEDLKIFLVEEIYLPSIEKYWNVEPDQLANPSIIEKKLIDNLSRIKEKKPLKELIEDVCQHFSLPLPEKYPMVISDQDPAYFWGFVDILGP